MKKYLVTYYTKTGTTKRAADYIANKLKESGQDAEAKSFNQVTTIDPYDTIVIGSPINGMNLVPEFKTFVSKYHQNLKKKETALFNVSYMYTTGRKMWRNAISKSFNKIELDPKAIGYFGGAIDKEMPLFARLIFGLKKGLPLDQWDSRIADTFVDQLLAD